MERIVSRGVPGKGNALLAFISENQAEQKAYINGILGIGITLIVLLVIWVITLIVLRCKGRDLFGCAAGFAFHSVDDENDNVDDDIKQEEPSNEISENSEEADSSNEMSESSFAEADSKDDEQEETSYTGSFEKSITPSKSKDQINEDWKSKSRDWLQSAWAATKRWARSAKPEDVERRKNQTRCVFGLVSLMSLICSILVITHMYTPLESATTSSADLAGDAAEIVEDLSRVTEALNEAVATMDSALAIVPESYDQICPEIPPQEFSEKFGFDIIEILDMVREDYQVYVPQIQDALQSATDTGDSITSVLIDVDEGISTTNKYKWIIPFIVGISMLTVFSQLELMVAIMYKERHLKDLDTSKFEKYFGWTVLIIQVIVVLISWVLVIAFFVSTFLTTDTCLPSFTATELGVTVGVTENDRGTPDDLVLAIIRESVNVSNDLRGAARQAAIDNAVSRSMRYITGCAEPLAGERVLHGRSTMEADPLAQVVVLQGVLQDTLEIMREKLSFARDVFGVDSIDDECGSSSTIGDFFSSMEALDGTFSTTIRAMKEGYDALSCPTINTLYVEAMYDIFCTDVATVSANGLVLFFLVALSGLILITLRAAWRTSE